MNFLLNSDELMMVLLCGDRYNCVHVPLAVGEILLKQDPKSEAIVIIRDNMANQYYDVWTKEGWDNECKRIEYLASFRQPIVLPKPSKESLIKQLEECAISNDMERAAGIAKQIKELYGNRINEAS